MPYWKQKPLLAESELLVYCFSRNWHFRSLKTPKIAIVNHLEMNFRKYKGKRILILSTNKLRRLWERLVLKGGGRQWSRFPEKRYQSQPMIKCKISLMSNGTTCGINILYYYHATQTCSTLAKTRIISNILAFVWVIRNLIHIITHLNLQIKKKGENS